MSAAMEGDAIADVDLIGNQDRNVHKHDKSVSEEGDHAGVLDSLVNNLASGMVLKNGDTGTEEDLQSNSQDNSPEVSETTKKEQACKCPSDAGGSSTSDGDDTHSDSIETLGEEGPPDEEGSLSGALMSGIDLSKSDAVCAEEKEVGQGAGEQDDDQGKDSIIVLGDQESEALQLESHKEAVRPESLSLPVKNNMRVDRKRSESDIGAHHRERLHILERNRSGSEGWAIAQSRAKNSVEEEEKLSKSLPHGTIRRKGDLIEFVADNLQDKIKRSSPMSRTDSGSMGSRQSSMRSLSSVCSSTSASTSVATSSGLSRSPSTQFTQSPDDIPPIDPQAVMELENQARLVADNIDLLLGNLRANLHKMSAITIGCLEAAKCSVDITCDSVDASIKSMYALMAKCEELSKHMPPVYKLAGQIAEIKRLLDLFEAQLAEKT